MVATRPGSLPADVWKRVNDADRRNALAALSVMESHKDDDFARINRLAATLFSAPSSAIAVVDASRAWLVSAVGTDLREIPVEHSFAAHCIAAESPVLLIPDACQDQRFHKSILVTGAPGIRFYVGAPIEVRGQRIGALQVFAPEPRDGVAAETVAQFGDLAGTCGALFELKDEARVRARTAAELIKEEWRHALTLEAGKVGSWVWDIRNRSVVANDILRAMFGLPLTGDIVVDQIFGAMHPDDRPAVEAAIEETFEHGVDYNSEFRLATGRWLIGRGRVYQRDARGKPLVMMGVNIDVTETRQTADHTRHLLRELNHRVKNTLAMIQSLARQTMGQSSDPAEFLSSFSGRLRTLSDAHALLADRDWSGVGILELIRSEVTAFLIDPAQLDLQGAEVQLPPDHALGLSIVLHELASNAARHGALTTPGGRVAVAWRLEEGHLQLSWIESGGPPITGDVQRRFGTRLIERGLDKVLGSRVELSFAPTGAEAKLTLPLP